MRLTHVICLVCLASLCLLNACSKSNNLLMGRVEAQVGTHLVVVTDCYRTSVPPPVKEQDSIYRFTPCRDADVLIRDEMLVVNGRDYGKLQPHDSVLVDHSVVSVNRGS